MGTDAAVFVNDKYTVDLKLYNPHKFPLRINYHLRDVRGNIIAPERFLRPLYPTDYALNFIVVSQIRTMH